MGGGFCNVIISTFMGGYLANGAWPWASSRSVMPRDLRAQAFSGSRGRRVVRVLRAPNVGLLVVSVGLLHHLGSHPAVARSATLEPAMARVENTHQHGVPTNVWCAPALKLPKPDVATP